MALANCDLWIGIKARKMPYITEADLAFSILRSTNNAEGTSVKIQDCDILSVQKIITLDHLWIVYCADDQTKTAILATKCVQIEGRNFDLLDFQAERVRGYNSDTAFRLSIHGFPFSVSDDEIEEWVDTWADRSSPVMKAKAKVTQGNRKHPQLLNGNRFCYVVDVFDPLPRYSSYNIPSPNNANDILTIQITVYYEGQTVNCRKCLKEDHVAKNCGDRSTPIYNQNLEIFRGREHPLSNHYLSLLTVDGQCFGSSEHLYQYLKATHCDDADLAKRIQQAKNPHDAKVLGDTLDERTNDWNSERLCYQKS